MGVPALLKKPTDVGIDMVYASTTNVNCTSSFGVKVVASRSTLPPYDSEQILKKLMVCIPIGNIVYENLASV